MKSGAESLPGAEAGAGVTVPALFQQTAGRQPDAPALHFRAGQGWASISWREYGRAVGRFANLLLAEGLAPQDRVAIWAGNRPEWHIADLGTLHAGGATVAIYPTLAPDQVIYILSHSETVVLVVEHRKFLDQISAVRDRLPRLARVVLLDGDPAGEGVIRWEAALGRGEEFGRSRPGLLQTRWQAVSPDDMASLIYTSGTTGTPKGAILTHHNLVWTAGAVLSFVPLSPQDRLVSFLPLAHILERMFSHMRQVGSGCQVYFCPSLEQLVPMAREVRPTNFIGVPRVWEKLYAGIRSRMDRLGGVQRKVRDFALRAGAQKTAAFEGGRRPAAGLALRWRIADRLFFRKVRQGLGLDQSRIFVSTAAAISPDILRFFYGLGFEILEIYGQTEVTGPTSSNRPGAVRLGTVGQAVPGVEVRIADDGEVLVRGPNVFKGYFKDATSTAEALKDGWLHSGDVGGFDADGFLRITDRKKDLFKTSGGKYVAPGAMENLLTGQGGIAQAVVLGDGRPYVSALVTLDPDSVKAKAGAGDPMIQRGVEEAIARVNRTLSHPEQIKKWKILDIDFVIGDELTPTLKVKRKRIYEKYAAEIEALYAEPKSA